MAGPNASTRPSALVTGASSGLGAGFARRLAASGHDLVLVARNRGALEALARELETAHGTKSEVLSADLGRRDELAAVVDRIGAGAPLNVVVNNAGFGFYGPVITHSAEQELGMVDVDVAAVVALSHAAMRVMVPRRAGRLLNVSSVAAFAATPASATYSAAKGFVLMFSEALHDEVAASGVHVTVLCPGFTRTRFQANAGIEAKGLPGFVWSDPDTVVDEALDALERNQAVCVPGLVNKLTAATPRFAPRPVVRRIAASVMKRL
ncbi:MAG TPA: SDR family oxidoreductase [Acidimicrobiales bacterium]|nr:SDR family oxidoreductase [Acidimicrobiales bacterium]